MCAINPRVSFAALPFSCIILNTYLRTKKKKKKKKKKRGQEQGMSVDLSLLNHINICVIALALKHAESIAILSLCVNRECID